MSEISFSSSARRLLAGILSVSLCFPVSANPISGSNIPNCPAGGYSIYYVNGMSNDYQDAVISGIALSTLALSKAVDTSILARTKLQTIYNPTDGFGLDLLESVGQMITGTVSNVTAYLTAAWVGVFGGLALPISGLDGVLTKFVDAFRTAVTKATSSASVSKVVNDAAPRIVADLNAGKVVVMVAHSQGNLYVNEIYDAVSQSVTPAKMALLKVINVASPTPRHVSGFYVLNNTDIIWQITPDAPTFRGDTVGNYPNALKFNEAVFQDVLGHNFVDAYLSTVPGSGSSLREQISMSLQQAFTSALVAAVENCPSNGGFASINLTCKRNADGSATIAGLYSAELLPGEQITAVSWSGEYLAGSTGNCASPTYSFPDNRQFGVPGEYTNSSCVPTEGLNLHPVYYATCHNPLSGTPRNIWVTLNGIASKAQLNNGTIMMMLCRATTANLNGTVPPSARPNLSLDTMIACN